jgi:Mg2+-importing ATPase
MSRPILHNKLFKVLKLTLLSPVNFMTGVIPFRTARTSFHQREICVSEKLISASEGDMNEVLQHLDTTIFGLDDEQVEARQEEYGFNDVAREKRQSMAGRMLTIIKNPLILLLAVLALVSFFINDVPAALIIAVLLGISILLQFFQEMNADRAAEKLKAMVTTTATVLRNNEKREIPLRELVPGDVVLLSAGDMIPADVRLISAKDLFVNRAEMTGESMPVEKCAVPAENAPADFLDLPNVCFLGSNVESGTAMAIVVTTGNETYFGSLAGRIVGHRESTSFDKGVNSFTWLMISFMAVMVPLVFLINWLSKGNWVDALLFALAVAVGLTPAMLPMIITVNLSRGAISMSRKKVIVKRLDSIQNFGTMDILCTDKTGTITEGRIVLERYLDIYGKETDKVLEYAYVNSYYQTGLKNLTDAAVLSHVGLESQLIWREQFRKLDEVPFDFVRRRMSVIVRDLHERHILICKGATEGLLTLCDFVDINEQTVPIKQEQLNQIMELEHDLSDDGFRVIALAYRIIPDEERDIVYSTNDETEMVFLGLLAFLDPPRQTAAETLEKLNQHQVSVKILTGDGEIITESICRKVGLSVKNILSGTSIEKMSDAKLVEAVDETMVFARLSPAHKERIVRALRSKGHVVGFMGDGINDTPALRAADVGISVNSAVDIAKESSDIILLETSLLVLEEGVLEGRRVFGNIIKYIRMAASSNFGNMFSIVGASIFLPFLPMLPVQVLINNMLYDFSQTTIPTDTVDQEWLEKPRKWSMGNIRQFILLIGPISSIFDYIIFFILLYVFSAWTKPELFHTGWFVESLFTQTLIIHVIRTRRIPFIQSRASWPLLVTTLVVAAIGAYLPFSPLAGLLGFVPLPPIYWAFLFGILICYIFLTQKVKSWFFRRFAD